VFEEAFRVMKDGGRLMISDIVSEGPLPMSVRGNAEQWGGCVNGALPEREYLDLIAQAGFQDIRTVRSDIGGEIEGVRVYSLSVSAHKGEGADDGPADVIPLTISASSQRSPSCCG
jgi:arsenite methyltransferase